MPHYQDYSLARSLPFGLFAATTTEYALDATAPGDEAELVTIYLFSALNQTVTVQRVGQPSPQPTVEDANKFDVGASVSVAQGEAHSLSIDRRLHPHSNYGLTVTTGATAPTAGNFTAYARVWPKHDSGEVLPHLHLVLQNLLTQQGELGHLIDANSQEQREVQALIQQILERSPGHQHGPLGRLLQERR